MSGTALLNKFKSEVGLTPVPGTSNVHVIQPRFPKPAEHEQPQMTDAEWDKFEADIHQAFEQLP